MLCQPDLIKQENGHYGGGVKLEATGDVKLSLDGVGGRHRRALVWEDVNRREVTPERVGRTAALQVVAQHLQARKMVVLKIVEVLGEGG